MLRLPLPIGSRRPSFPDGAGAALPLLTSGLGACAYGFSLPFRRRSVAPLVARPLSGPLTYVAIGASDAVGWGVPDRARDGWVPTVARALPQPTRLVNLGVGGTRLRAALTQQLPRAIDVQPDLVTIWLVVNDVLGGVSLDSYSADLHHMLGELRTKTSAVIAIGNAPYPPAVLDPWGFPEIVKKTITGRWNAVIAAAARAHGAIAVDLYRRWPLARHPEFIGPDGLHPTHTGYRSLADTFLTTLREHEVLG